MPEEAQGQLNDDERDLVMHVELEILNGHVLMGTDMLRSMGHELRVGNNVTVCVEPDTIDDARRIYDALARGGTDSTGLNRMFWGAWWGTCLDRFEIRWMVSVRATD